MNKEEKILVANKVRRVGESDYDRLILKTHVVTEEDEILDVVSTYCKNFIQDEDDIIFLSEKMVACTQQRAIPMDSIKPRTLAKVLSHFVTKTSAGIGLGIPETMEMALQECGTPRILFAACVSIVGKIFRKRGWFYIVAGEKARGIDGPCEYTLPPYNHYVVLLPENPNRVAAEVAKKLKCKVAVIDANDLGINIIGVSDDTIEKELLCDILRDNPLGQEDECTPMGIVRKVG